MLTVNHKSNELRNPRRIASIGVHGQRHILNMLHIVKVWMLQGVLCRYPLIRIVA